MAFLFVLTITFLATIFFWIVGALLMSKGWVRLGTFIGSYLILVIIGVIWLCALS